MGMIFSEFESSAWEALCSLDRSEAEHLSYGPHEAQFIEYWRPTDANEPRPVIVLIHGGCWSREYDISHIRPLATALASQGYVVWAPEYRRLGQDGGGWPGTFEDVGMAVDLLAKRDDAGLDSQRVAFVGHSAGGHLALWASGRSRLRPAQALHTLKPFVPRCVIGLAAITDLQKHIRESDECRSEALKLMDGDAARRPDRYQQASPVLLGTDVPVFLIHGDSDVMVSGSQATAMPGAEALMLEGAGHFDMIHPGASAFTALLQTLEAVMAP